MITFKDLTNRVYSDKECIRFEYEFIANERRVVACFERDVENKTEWNMHIVFGRTRDKDSEVYNFGYVMPKEDLPLTLITATGLRFFQLHIQREVQEKSNLDFAISEIIKGM